MPPHSTFDTDLSDIDRVSGKKQRKPCKSESNWQPLILLIKIREENDIYENDEALTEYKMRANQYVEIIKKIRSEGDNTMISIFKAEKYKNALKEKVSEKMK